MALFDALVHITNFFIVALGVGATSAGLAKLVWRRELRSVAWWVLAAPACAAAAAVSLGGLVLLGQDGRMATYAAMLLVCAITLWWRAFGPGRR